MKTSKKNRDKAASIERLYHHLRSGSRAEWLRRSKKGHEFFLGEQLSPAERKAMAERLMPDFIINKMQPQIELAIYFCTANRPSWKAVGVDGSDSDLGHLSSDVLQHIGKVSKVQTVMSTVIRDAFTKSVGYFMADIDPNLDQGRGEVLLTSLDPWEVFVDPASRDPLFTDAGYILIAKQYTLEQFSAMMPKYAKQAAKAARSKEDETFIGLGNPTPSESLGVVDDMFGPGPVDFHSLEGGFDSFGYDQKYVRYYELYRKVTVPMVNLIVEQPSATGEGVELANMTMSGEEYGALIKMQPEFEAQVRAISEWDRVAVVRSKSLGCDYMIEEEIPMPGDMYPIVPVSYLHTGNVYPISMAWNLTGKQEEINKAHQLVIHHATIASNFKYMAEEKMILDNLEWEKNSSKPGGILIYRRGVNGEKPDALMPAPLNSAFYQITQKGEADMEYLSGMSSGMMGQEDYSGREAYRGLLARDQFGSRRVSAWVRNMLDPAMEQVGKILLAWARSLFSPDKVINVAIPGDEEQWAQRGIVTGYPMQAVEQFFDDTSASYDIMYVAGSSSEVNRWARREENKELFQLGIIDDWTLLQSTDLPGKTAIYDRVGLISQLKSQAEQLAAQMEELTKRNTHLERQLVEERVNAKVGTVMNALLRSQDQMKLEMEELVRRAEEEVQTNAKTSQERTQAESQTKSQENAPAQGQQQQQQQAGTGSEQQA